MTHTAGRYAWILWVLLAVPASGRELPSFFEGVRPLGMGGAFTAVADDENAVFYNPAGLDRVPAWGLGVVNPLVEVGEDGLDFARDAQDTDFDDAGEVTDLLRDYVGTSEHYRAALFPHFVMRHLELGVLAQVSATLQPNNRVFPETDVAALQTLSAHLGTGFGFFEGRLRLGAAAKYVQAHRLDEVYTVEHIAAPDFRDRVEDDLEEGRGFGVDLGAMVTAPVALEPTLGLTVLNVGDTNLGDAGELPQQINLGVSVHHRFSWLEVTGAADWVDVTTRVGEDDDPYKRLHFGVESRFPKVLSIRGGLYQGYATLGATVDLWALRLDYATYAEELGSAAGDRADRRHVAQLTLGW